MERTKIICTLGPACEDPLILEKMIKTGMDIARLNFSHGTQAWHAAMIDKVRTLSAKSGRPIGLMADIQGPRIRVGVLDTPLTLEAGEIATLMPDKNVQIINQKFIPVTYEKLAADVKVGEPILISDGLIELQAVGIEGDQVMAQVTRGGTVTSGRGMNFPQTKLTIPSLTEKDKEDIKFALEQGISLFAMSFVRKAEDVEEARSFFPGVKPYIIAKIELRSAIKNFPEILKAASAIMVARGDLGLEIPPEDVPVAQKDIIASCLKAGKPVIVATQMMESMTHAPRPTRAEVSDVANAVIDHTDAVMLSGETALGEYPIETVEMMNKTIRETEASRYDDLELAPMRKQDKPRQVQAILVACSDIHKCAQSVSRLRPEMPIFAPCQDARAAQALTLSWGVYPFILPNYKLDHNLAKQSQAYLKKQKLIKPSDGLMVIKEQSSSLR